MTSFVEPVHAHLHLGGEAVDGAMRLEVRNPARPDELVGTIVRGTPGHVDQAVAAARQAQPAWAALSFAARAAQLERAIAQLDEDLDLRARLFVRENGKPFAQARAELGAVPRRQRMALDYAARLDSGHAYPAAGGRTVVRNRPYGVVVSIVPWNSPDMLAFIQIVAALLAGNAVVLKPPESCPLTLIDSARRFAAVLPAGLLNVVTGLPPEIGDRLTTHPGVGKIGFTGSIPAARHIMGNAALSIKDVTLELGGNDAAILLDDVKIDDAMLARMRTASFMMSGQICMAIKRIYVPRRRADEFLDRYARAIDELVVGDGLLPEVTMGPLHSRAGLERAEGFVEEARRLGATVQAVGRVADRATFDQGHFMRPTLVTQVPDHARIMVEEQFCPVIPIALYDSVDEAVARANDSPFGLGGSVWSADVERAMDVAGRIEAGQVWVNTHGILSINYLAPYGGVKQSGIGRKSGIEGIHEYVQSQTITTHEHA